MEDIDNKKGDDYIVVSDRNSRNISYRLDKNNPRLFWWSFLAWVYLLSEVNFVFPDQKIKLGDFTISGLSETLILQGLFYIIAFYFWRGAYFSVANSIQFFGKLQFPEIVKGENWRQACLNVLIYFLDSINDGNIIADERNRKYFEEESGAKVTFLLTVFSYFSSIILYIYLPIYSLYKLYFLAKIELLDELFSLFTELFAFIC